MPQPLVSVVIPAYNEEKNITACLKSIKAQTYQGPVEIVVSDNNSTDSTPRLAKEEGAIVVFEPKAGVIYARETGTRAAKGEIIVQTDADTTFPANWLETIMEAFAKNPDASAVVGSFVFVDGPWWGRPFTGILFGLTDLFNRICGRIIYIPGANTAFKKALWYGYNVELDQGGDEIGLLKQLRKEGKIVFLRKNAVFTSARRLTKGLFYNIFVTFFYYYILDYTYRRITGRGIGKPFPRIRK